MPAPLLKDIFSRDVVAGFGEAAASVDPAFDRAVFESRVLDRAWPGRELKDRIRHIARCLYGGMSGNYPKRIRRLMKMAPRFSGLPCLVFPDVVECYGIDDWEESMAALECFTILCSSEFAVRPFILKDPARMMKQMARWAGSENEHVRRLASEGCRPRLPWAMALPLFKKDPKPVLRILEILRCDSSEYVRRSVANNLNDISKDHPDILLDVARRWMKENPETTRLLKHACRTLLKKGDQRALRLFGVAGSDRVTIDNLRLKRNRVKIGHAIEFEFRVRVEGEKPIPLRIEYAIDYLKSNARHGRKIFKLAERAFAGAESLARRHAVHDMTTRTHYSGRHHLHIIVNGNVLASADFVLES